MEGKIPANPFHKMGSIEDRKKIGTFEKDCLIPIGIIMIPSFDLRGFGMEMGIGSMESFDP